MDAMTWTVLQLMTDTAIADQMREAIAAASGLQLEESQPARAEELAQPQ